MSKESRAWLGAICMSIVLLASLLIGIRAAKAAPACDVAIGAPADLQARLNAAGPGKRICLSGTFRTSVGNIRPLAGQTIIGGKLQYTGGYNLCRSGPGCDMNDGYELFAYGITLQGVEVADFEGKGVRCGDHSIIRGSYFHGNRQNGISCWADNAEWHVQILDNRIIDNGSKALEYNAAAGVKLLGLAKPASCLGCGATVSGNVASNNHGNGIWFDQSSSGIIAWDNVTNGNTHFGMRCEKCAGPVSWAHNSSSGNAFSNYSLRNTANVWMADNRGGGIPNSDLVITYAAKDDKTYPNLGDPALGYHPWRIIVNDARLFNRITGCDVRNVDCRA